MYPAYPVDLHAQPVVQQRRHTPGFPKSQSVSPIPDKPIPVPSSLSMLPKVLVWNFVTETGSSYPYWGEKEQTVSVYVPSMSGTTVSHILGIFALVGNPASCVQAGNSRNISSALPD